MLQKGLAKSLKKWGAVPDFGDPRALKSLFISQF